MNAPLEADMDRKRRLERIVAWLVGLFVIEFVALPVIGLTQGPSGALFYGSVGALVLTGIALMWLSYRIRDLNSRDVSVPRSDF